MLDESTLTLVKEAAKAAAEAVLRDDNRPALLTPKQVALELGVPVKSLEMWRFKGKGPPFKRIGKLVRYPSAELREWIKAQPDGGCD